jgi:hypothetical protein
MKKPSIYLEFLEFLREQKKLWLVPLLVIFGLVATVLIAAKAGGVLAPFIYTLF